MSRGKRKRLTEAWDALEVDIPIPRSKVDAQLLILDVSQFSDEVEIESATGEA